jgi:hypothetical protein
MRCGRCGCNSGCNRTRGSCGSRYPWGAACSWGGNARSRRTRRRGRRCRGGGLRGYCRRARRRCGSRCDFRRQLLRTRGLRHFLGFGGFFRCSQATEMFSDTLGVHEIDRAGVRLLLGDASFWEVLDQDFRLDLEFSSQFIDTDLIGICHSPLVLNATSYLSTAAYVASAKIQRARVSLRLPRIHRFLLREFLLSPQR